MPYLSPLDIVRGDTNKRLLLSVDLHMETNMFTYRIGCMVEILSDNELSAEGEESEELAIHFACNITRGMNKFQCIQKKKNDSEMWCMTMM